jgi:hypothetical protein
MKLRTNVERLVRMGVSAKVDPPIMRGYRVSPEGEARMLPSVGGVVYNVLCGDPARGWAGDHVEPGASLGLPPSEGAQVTALNNLAQIGNSAEVLSGAAKGARGVVTGKHGGIEHVLVDFAPRDLRRLASGDTVQIEAFGLGLELLDFPEVRVMNLDPGLLGRLGLAARGGQLVAPVALSVPAELMGSGLGRDSCQSGDYDLQCFDPKAVRRWGLDALRLGDLVAITDADHSYGRIYRQGAVSIGVVIHADCVTAGHGPGITTVLTSATGAIRPVRSPGANIARILRVGRFRRGARRG